MREHDLRSENLTGTSVRLAHEHSFRVPRPCGGAHTAHRSWEIWITPSLSTGAPAGTFSSLLLAYAPVLGPRGWQGTPSAAAPAWSGR
eukprot:498388-Prorocentrum_minimum.AAC.1